MVRKFIEDVTNLKPILEFDLISRLAPVLLVRPHKDLEEPLGGLGGNFVAGSLDASDIKLHAQKFLFFPIEILISFVANCVFVVVDDKVLIVKVGDDQLVDRLVLLEAHLGVTHFLVLEEYLLDYELDLA